MEQATGNMICEFEEQGPMCEMKSDAISTAAIALSQDDSTQEDSKISKTIKSFFDNKVRYIA